MAGALGLNQGERQSASARLSSLWVPLLCAPQCGSVQARPRSQERHFLCTALSAHLLCAQPELPLINCALLPRAGFDAGLPKRARHTQEMSLMWEQQPAIPATGLRPAGPMLGMGDAPFLPPIVL